MFGSKMNNGLINQTHKRALRAVYSDFTDTSFDILLEKDKGVSVHVLCLRTLMVEVFKSLKHLNAALMWNFFLPKPSKYDLRL